MRENKLFIVMVTLAVLFGARFIINKIFDQSVHRSQWYSIKIPEGWEKRVEDKEVIFISPQKNVITEIPDAVFSIYSMQSKGALFIEDLFIDALKSLSAVEGKIIDKGEIKINGQIARWILFHQKGEIDFLVLTFLIVDDFNRFTRIQFYCRPDKFREYRPEFERFKDSIKFKKFF